MGEGTGSLPIQNNHSGWPGRGSSRCRVAARARDDGIFDRGDTGYSKKQTDLVFIEAE